MQNLFKVLLKLFLYSLVFWILIIAIWVFPFKDKPVEVLRKIEEQHNITATNLLEAIDSQNLEKVRSILATNFFDINKMPEKRVLGYLARAVIDGNVDIVREILKHGATVNPACHPYVICKPIIWAAENGDIDILKLLITHNANVNAVGPYSFPVLRYALLKNRYESVKILLDSGADINQRDQFAISNFELAISNNDLSFIKLMLKYNPDLNAGNFPEKITPLMVAAKTGPLEVVKLLIEHGSDINIKTSAGHTALDYAAKNNNHEILRYLQSNQSSHK